MHAVGQRVPSVRLVACALACSALAFRHRCPHARPYRTGDALILRFAMGCAASKQVEPTQPGPGQRPKTEAGAGAQATAEAQAMGSSPLLLRDEQLDATILHSAVCRPSTTRPFVRCRAGSANLPASWWTYPRWSMMDSVGKPWVMHNMSTVQVLPGAASCNGTTALHDFALLIPAMWGHTYHFYVEWLYHLLVFSRRRAAAHAASDCHPAPRPNASLASSWAYPISARARR